MSELKDFQSPVRPTWCPGCGNHGIWNALKMALVGLDLSPHEVLLVSGIGCGSKLPDYTRANGYQSIHGRAVPVATGAKLANHALKVIAVHGDGDGYGMGMGHFVHAARRNIDITDVLQNNQIYGLTKGQYSPTSELGTKSKTSPEGAIEHPVNPLAIAIAAGATFVSRGFALDPKQLSRIMMEAIQHKGYALIDVLQPCVTFNRVNTYDWYKQRVFKVEDEEGYDPTDRVAAFQTALQWGDRIPTGIVYRVEGEPSYEEQVPALTEGPLVKQPLGRPIEAYEALKEEFV
jgi:2-oxoglutarate ferredoxin oxidoreductase subunit beta